MEKESDYYDLALSMVKGIGIQSARALIEFFGSSEVAFAACRKTKRDVPIELHSILNRIKNFKEYERLDQEYEWLQKRNVQILFINHPDYPRRLLQCEDAPLILFYKGNVSLNAEKVVAIIGTREPSQQALIETEKLVKQLGNHNVLILSGLAYGVDYEAHKVSYKNNIPTVGVLGHGLDIMYPSTHDQLAKRMQNNGGLLTEFLTGNKPDRQNFPKRNRIVAGMSDVVVVMESSIRGGSMITARMANEYNRDVFAFPKLVGDERGAGCNALIKKHRAALMESIEDIEYIMNWTSSESIQQIQRDLFPDLDDNEQSVFNYLKSNKEAHIDEISYSIEKSMAQVSGVLLALEFKGIVKSLPGKKYILV